MTCTNLPPTSDPDPQSARSPDPPGQPALLRNIAKGPFAATENTKHCAGRRGPREFGIKHATGVHTPPVTKWKLFVSVIFGR